MVHAAAAQELLEISNELLANPAFPVPLFSFLTLRHHLTVHRQCYVHIPLPRAENLDGHMRAFRVTQQFLRTHIDMACSVLDTVEQDMARLTTHIETTESFRTGV
jgi:hypothetical protein